MLKGLSQTVFENVDLARRKVVAILVNRNAANLGDAMSSGTECFSGIKDVGARAQRQSPNFLAE
jgi:hypothetical protein